MSTRVGTGDPGFSGDGGPALRAALNEPKGLALDRKGHLFIADSENHVVRRVDRLTGIITTVAGNGVFGDRGDGGPATNLPRNLRNPAPSGGGGLGPPGSGRRFLGAATLADLGLFGPLTRFIGHSYCAWILSRPFY